MRPRLPRAHPRAPLLANRRIPRRVDPRIYIPPQPPAPPPPEQPPGGPPLTPPIELTTAPRAVVLASPGLVLRASTMYGAPALENIYQGRIVTVRNTRIRGHQPWEWWEVTSPIGQHGFLAATDPRGAPYLRIL